jgi:hypothetical protein
MLRYVVPEGGELAPNLTNLLQQMTQLTVFCQVARAEVDVRTLELVAEALAGLTALDGNYLPRFHFVPREVAEVIATSFDDIKAGVTPVGEDWRHPYVFALQELIETVFAGPDEDPKERFVNATLF